MTTNSPFPVQNPADPAKVAAIPLFIVCAAATWAALAWNPLIVAAGLYAVVYCVVAWRWPWLAQIFIIGAVPFQQDIGGGGPVLFSVVEAHLALYTVVVFLRLFTARRPIVLGPVIWPVILYLVICVISAAYNFRGGVAIVSLAQMTLYMVVSVAVFASATTSPKIHVPCLWAFVIISAAVGAFSMVAGVGVMGLNKNGLGATFASAVIVATELWFSESRRSRRHIMAILLMVLSVGLLFTLSRGGWISAMSGLVVIVMLRRRYDLLLRMLVAIAPIIAVAWYLLPAEKRDYATDFSETRYSIAARYKSFDYAWSEFKSSPVVGVGVGMRKEYDATNIIVTALAETGVPGCAAFLFIHAVLGLWLWRMRRRLPQSSGAFSLAVLAGALISSRLVHGLVDHYWSRGAISIAWAALGMAAGAVALHDRGREAAEI